MKSNDFKINISQEEIELLREISKLQKEENEIDADKLNDQMLDDIKETSINNILGALGMSELNESKVDLSKIKNTPLDYDKEHKEYLAWSKKPIGERSDSYKSKFVAQGKFDAMLDNNSDHKYNRKVIAGKHFDRVKKELRAENPDGYISSATGKKMKHGEKYHYDHNITAYDTDMNPVNNQFLTRENKIEFLNSRENIATIEAHINQSKGKKTTEDFLQSKSKLDKTKTNAEYYGLDEKSMLQKDIQSSKKRVDILEKSSQNRKGIGFNKERSIKAAKQAGKEISSNVGKAALKVAVGQLLSISVVEITKEYKRKESIPVKQKAKNISSNILRRSKEILERFKGTSFSTFISSLIDMLVKSLGKIIRNIVKVLKTTYTHILEAVKVLFSKGASLTERISKALKILGAALVVVLGVALEEAIQKAMETFLPFTVPFAGLISPILSSLIIGIGSVLVLHFFQKKQNRIKLSNVQADLSDKTEKMAILSTMKATKSSAESKESINQTISLFANSASYISEVNKSIVKIKESINLTSRNNALTQSETKQIIDDNASLLNLLSNS